LRNVVSPIAPSKGCGSENQIAYNWASKMYSKNKKQLHIIKSAIGGASLADQSDSVQTNWSTQPDQLWETVLNYVIRPAILDLLEEGKKQN
jgi:hypothetical protein